jgi:hypothetical protein
MVIDRNPMVARYAQVGVDPLELPRIIAHNLMAGDWMAVTARPKTGREAKRWRRWLDFNAANVAGSHHSIEANAMTFTLLAGSARGMDVAQANLRAITAGMPGFDLTSHTQPVSDSRRHLLPGLLAMLLVVGAVTLPGLIPPDGLLAEAPIRGILGVLAALLFAFSLLRFFDIVKPADRKSVLAADRLAFLPPARRRGRVKPPRRQTVGKDGKVVPERPGDYPLAASVFMGSPNMFVSMCAPAAGAEAGLRETSSRQVPPALATRVGPLIGRDPSRGQPVCLIAERMRFGLFITGMAGSGKSQLIRSLFAYTLLDKLNPTLGVSGNRGPDNTIIAIENKGPDGAEYYRQWSEQLGGNVAFSELADPDTPAIDFFASGQTDPQKKARDFVDAMVYAWSEQEIGNRAKDVLIRTIHAGLVIESQQQIVEEANQGLQVGEPRIPTGKSAVTYAQILCQGGAGGDAAAVRLAAALRALAPDEPSPHDGQADMLWNASIDLNPLFVGKSERDRSARFESSLNKLERLAGREDWFSPARRKTTWQFVLENHKDIVVNLGQSMSGKTVADDETQRLSAIAMFTLRTAIRRTCNGWAANNRWVSIFADELALLAGSSAEVVSWLRDQGRAFGVCVVFGTQRPDQVDFEVRQAMLSMETLIAFAQSSPDVINAIVGDLSLDGTEWSNTDIAQLPQYTAAVRTSGPGGRLPSLVVRMDYFEGDMAAFAAQQGYTDGDPVPAAVGA